MRNRHNEMPEDCKPAIIDAVIDQDLYMPIGPETIGSAGQDLRNGGDGFEIAPGQTVTVDTKFSLHLQNPSFAGLVIPRSGMARNGITLVNGVGLIDSDYLGTIKLDLLNTSNHNQWIGRKIRLAQLVILRVLPPFAIHWQFKDKHDAETERGDKGFGSTGNA